MDRSISGSVDIYIRTEISSDRVRYRAVEDSSKHSRASHIALSRYRTASSDGIAWRARAKRDNLDLRFIRERRRRSDIFRDATRRDRDITNAIKVRVLGEAQRASRLVVQTSWLFTYGRISLFRALVLLVCLIILIRVVSALACRGIRGAGREGLARAMLAMSGKGGML